LDRSFGDFEDLNNGVCDLRTDPVARNECDCVQTKHGRIVHKTGATRPDEIRNIGLDVSPFVDLDSVVKFEPGLIRLNGFVGRVLPAACDR
jgi:hypothetical protein